RARGANGKPMKLESGHLVYRELDATIVLSPWVRLKRDTSTLEGGDTVVTLNKDGGIELIQTKNAKGNELDPKRLIEYAADQLTVHYSEHGDVDRAFGESNSRVVASTETART